MGRNINTFYIKPCRHMHSLPHSLNGPVLMTYDSSDFRINVNDHSLDISFEEWRDYLLFHPSADLTDIISHWRHNTVRSWDTIPVFWIFILAYFGQNRKWANKIGLFLLHDFCTLTFIEWVIWLHIKLNHTIKPCAF